MDYLALYVTLKLALATTIVLMILAAPVAYLLAYARFPENRSWRRSFICRWPCRRP